MGKDAHWQLKQCLEAGQHCVVLAVDMNRDNRKDYVVFRITGEYYDGFAGVYAKLDKGWEFAGSFYLQGPGKPPIEELEALLAKADYTLADNPWHNLKIGRHTQQFRPQ